MALYKKLDLWSITDGLDRMMDYCYNGNEKGSPYWGYYYELINALSIAASDMYIELDTLKSHLYREMPYKRIAFSDEDDSDQTAIAWFNTAAAMLYDTDMTELLENENIFCADEWEEKKKRIAALGRLTKRQQTVLFTEVTAFVTRYLELSAAFDTIEAVINELDYHQSAVARRDAAAFHQASYV